MKKGIIGAGGFGREVYWSLNPIERNNTVFFVDDEYWDNTNERILPLSLFDTNKYEVVVAIADSKHRERIVNNLPKKTKYFTHIHPSAQIHGEDVTIGEGSIICAGTIITTNVKIGKHAHLNLITTIGHDCIIGDYFTTAPGVQISGNENIGDRVYFGTRSCVKQKITICDDVVIGMNAGVVKNITESGTYVGCPAIKIK
jgi:sugar O-acyltransferase (sialic acid O-acetyltransferase NeuD family)|tara:strand:+ start:162 stop:761 length:600 start_codon:yes stop_codon:yes gene_type:complete